MTLRVVLRIVAVLIAVAGIADPVITLDRPVRSPIVIVVDDAIPSAIASAERLADLLRGEYDVRVRPLKVRLKADPTSLEKASLQAHLKADPPTLEGASLQGGLKADPISLAGGSLWGPPLGGPSVALGGASAQAGLWGDRVSVCAVGENCVLVGGDRWPASAPGQILGALRFYADVEAGVTITRVQAPTATHASAVGQLLVALEGREVDGQTTTIDVLDGDVPVGRAEHTWTTDQQAEVPVQWWPLGHGLRRLSVRVTRKDAGTPEDDRIDAGIEVDAEPYNVLVYDTRPSWTSTFIRRALEQDARMALRVAARLGPRLEVTAGAPFRLDDATLSEASAVVIGAPDGLSAHEVDALERFLRVRGGSLVLAPDARPTGPIARLLPARLTEKLEPSPVMVGEWRASELLIAPDVRAGASILAKAGDDAVVIATPSGNGRVIVFGAMDAWRYRDSEKTDFDRAWQSLVVDAAAAAGRPIDVTVDRPIVRPMEDIAVDVRLHAMAAPEAATAVSATIACNDQRPRHLRLWPTGDRRHFQGRVSPEAVGTCRIAVSSSAPQSASAAASIMVAGDLRLVGAAREPPSLERIARLGGVPVRSAGDETTLARDIRQRAPVERAPSPVQPMRSPWWIVPFAGCLGLEWWQRRRHGLR